MIEQGRVGSSPPGADPSLAGPERVSEPLLMDHGKHVPPDHPVLRRRSVREAAQEAGHPLPAISATEIAAVGDRIDWIAMAVRNLRNQPLTPAQAERLRIIARELARRANHPEGGS